MLNDLYFKTTCNIRPHFLGPMGGLKIEGPLYSPYASSLLQQNTLWDCVSVVPVQHDQINKKPHWSCCCTTCYRGESFTIAATIFATCISLYVSLHYSCTTTNISRTSTSIPVPCMRNQIQSICFNVEDVRYIHT